MRELIVDNFAGGGGASTGIEMNGLRVDIAVNHDSIALGIHESNHPWTRHFCENVWAVDPVVATKGHPVGLAWFSPDCKHFSKAKGGKPVEKKIRSLAWVATRWAKDVHPRLIVIENVEEFADWGPLTADNKPCPLRKGKTFRAWKHRLENLGYEVEYKILRASDYGAPTIRKRLFLVARCDGQPIVWPEPTHGDPKTIKKSGILFKSGLKPWRTAAECIDWSIPCPSIFERKKPLAEATLKRIAKGIMRYVVLAADPFIVPLTHQGSDRVNDINEPMKTVTGAHRGEMALISPYLTKYHGESAGSDISEPFPTITANSFHKRPGGNPPVALVAPVLTEHANASSPRCMPPNEPLRTICAETKGGHHALLSATIVKNNAKVVLDDPLHTITTQGNKHALVAAFLAKHYGGVVGHGVNQPLGTVTTSDHHSLVTAHIQRDFSQSVGAPADEPVGTITAGGSGKAALVTSNLVKLRGTCRDGQSVDEPMPTVTAGGNHIAEVRAFLLKYYGTDQNPNLREPLHTVRTKDCFGLVTINEIDYQIVDIGMRMLTPRELFRAQGFPDDYVIDRLPDGTEISKSDQVRLCGNSVCPPIAAAIIKANYSEVVEAVDVGA